ncbi:MAG TPA: response regulator [Chloroflexota bacterium]|nr:response regulator [Chloroflexota bacterium]
MILVIDDEPAITELLRDILEYHGYPVMVAHDAQEALDLLALHPPSLILLDLMMPAIDGLSLAMTLRHTLGTRMIPLIAMSASDSTLEMANRLGDFDGSISKPFETADLMSSIERFLPVAS